MFVLKKARVYMLSVHVHAAEAARATCLSQRQLGEILPQSVCGRRLSIDTRLRRNYYLLQKGSSPSVKKK